jgi:hypothetical protein
MCIISTALGIEDNLEFFTSANYPYQPISYQGEGHNHCSFQIIDVFLIYLDGFLTHSSMDLGVIYLSLIIYS